MCDGNHVDVLAPQVGSTDQRAQMALRVLCKFKAPVGGISIKEHFEVNVVPLVIQLTARFYCAVMAFFFPGRGVDTEEDDSDDDLIAGTSLQVYTGVSLIAVMLYIFCDNLKLFIFLQVNNSNTLFNNFCVFKIIYSPSVILVHLLNLRAMGMTLAEVVDRDRVES